MPMKYRTIKSPPVCGNLSVKEAEKSARTVADMNGSRTLRADEKVGTLRPKTMSGSNLTHLTKVDTENPQLASQLT